MDPFSIGVMLIAGASGMAAAARWARARRAANADHNARAMPLLEANTARREGELDVGDVLTYLDQEYWLAGEITLEREGNTVFRVMPAPEGNTMRWVVLPRDAQRVLVLREAGAFAQLGWPGVEVPYEGRRLRRTEYGNVGMRARGEVPDGWDVRGRGRFALLRAADMVALVLEDAKGKLLALVGKEVPRTLVEKLG